MEMLTLPQVPGEEAAPFYGDFLAAFPDGRVGMHLQTQAIELEALCVGLDESGAMFRYAEGKWTVKEVIGHLLDTERVFAYRLLRISRGDVTAMPGFDERRYVPEGQFNLRRVSELFSEFKLQRASTLALANGIPSAAWPRCGTANGFRTSARALVYIILGHSAHHLEILRERYRLSADTSMRPANPPLQPTAEKARRMSGSRLAALTVNQADESTTE
ncbi:MAG: DinB family protein [Longimicrobiales bacterium]